MLLLNVAESPLIITLVVNVFVLAVNPEPVKVAIPVTFALLVKVAFVPLRVTASSIVLLFKLTLEPLRSSIVPLKVFRLPLSFSPSVLNVKLSPLPLIVSA